jgi:hypothetical protein
MGNRKQPTPLPTNGRDANYRAWLETRPPSVRAVAERVQPTGQILAYHIPPTDGVYTLKAISENEDGTVTLKMLRWQLEGRLCVFEVFGIKPEDVVPIGPAWEGDDGRLCWQEGTVQ